MRKVGRSNHNRDRLESFKQTVLVTLSNAWKRLWISQVLLDDIENRCPMSQQLCHAKKPSLLNILRKVGFSNPSRDRPKLLKQVVTIPLLNARQQVLVSQTLEVDHYKWMPPVKACATRYRTLTAQWLQVPSLGQNLQTLTGNGDVSI